MDPLLADYGSAFDAIYTVDRTRFGTEIDTDNNPRLMIVFSAALAAYKTLLGYFSPSDKYPAALAPGSNEGDIFYVTTNPDFQGPLIKGTLAHEFQHMIYFDQHYHYGVTNTYTWLNEALSQAAEYYNGYTANHLSWIYDFLSGGWQGLSLTSWTSRNYGYGAIFIRYLIDRFGDAAIYNMCSTPNTGIAAVEAATNTDFNTIFNDFTRAIVMSGTDDSTDPRYAFTTLNLQAVQPSGRGGLYPSSAYAAGGQVSGSIYAYSIQFMGWTGSFGTMSLNGTAGTGTAFGLSR
jgi:hypothetical protein